MSKMASVKANVYVPPVEEKELLETLEHIELSKINIHVIIYILMCVTVILFIKKLISTACRRHEQEHSAKQQ